MSAWILSRYADVSGALRDPRLTPPGTNPDPDRADRVVHRRPTPPEPHLTWRAEIARSARHYLRRSPPGGRLDLVASFARPWSLDVAASLVGVPAEDKHRLSTLAHELFLAAAQSNGTEISIREQSAAAELARLLDGAGGELGVQTFVALSQTLPALLAGAWLALLLHPGEQARLRGDLGLLPHAVEELLRHASPSRAVFRQAVEPVSIGSARIGTGQRVILMLAAANRDPARFPDPGRLDLFRDFHGHLAFGGGSHGCAGARLIRTAVAVATDALLRETEILELAGPVKWIDGFAIRAPASLPVTVPR